MHDFFQYCTKIVSFKLIIKNELFGITLSFLSKREYDDKQHA